MKKLFLYAVDLLSKPFDQYYLNKDRKKYERELESAVIRLGASDETKRLRQDIFNNPAKKTRILFSNLQNRADQKVVEMIEDTKFAVPGTPDYANEHDYIFHGKLVIKGYKNGSSDLSVLDEKDIYMYQPRVTCMTNGGMKKISVGPKFLRSGNMNGKACYCYKDSTGILRYASLPKREILSNRIFDFDSANGDLLNASAREIFGEDAEYVGKFISINYDKDVNGSMIPIPVEQEQTIVNNYQRPENQIDLENIISQVKRQIYREKEIKKDLEEQIRKRESMRRVAESKLTDTSAPEQSETDRLNEENARILNDKLKYGIQTPGERGLDRPMPPHFGGPMGMPPMDGGPTLGRRL